jgi:ketosteroid isomerase-like protein
MTQADERTRREISTLLDGLRDDVKRGTITLYRRHLAADAVVLAMEDPRIFHGKEACLEYLRLLGQQVHFHELDGEMEDLKVIGDVAVALERYETKYEVQGRSYRDTARVTTVLVRDGSRWLLTHLHLESLAPNRIVN